MSDKISVIAVTERLGLTPYQSYILEKNIKKYDLHRLIKRGDILYAPYVCDDTGDFKKYISRILFGPRADLIGSDRMLIEDQRGIKIYSNGIYSAHAKGGRYYADHSGNRINRSFFMRLN